MKKYIATILIPCTLLQLLGCYSSREISLEELQNSDEVILTTKDSATYYLKKEISIGEILYNPDTYFSNDWIIKQNPGVVTLITQKVYKEYIGDEEVSIINKDTANINYEDINNISMENIDTGNTILLVGISLVSILGIAFTVFALTFHF